MKKNYEIGVIIGRFQLDELHEAHIDLIQSVINRHSKVILFLGVAPTLGTKRNPLDFSTRKAMIEEKFGSKLSAILPIFDSRSNKFWSDTIDTKIREVFQMGDVVLYGSRDSFIPYYEGKFDTCELEPNSYVSASDIRDKISKEIRASKEFRAGVVYGIYNTFPTVYSTIDVAILNEDNTKVLLGQKKDENRFRFIGGFVDINDKSLIDTVKREGREETGLELDEIKYITSTKAIDWRYTKEPERGIMTHFHTAKYIFGSPQPNDDIVVLKWFDIKSFTNKIFNNDYLVNGHQNLMEILLKNLNN